MPDRSNPSYTLFIGTERIESGDPVTVALATKARFDAGERRPIRVFDDTTGDRVSVNWRGTPEDVRTQLTSEHADQGDAGADAAKAPAQRAPGRPRLGVVGREVTLLPRHWEWLNAQPGGASVALRKLVERARRDNVSADRVRRAQEVAYRFMSMIAGDEPGFEEAARALFARDKERFATHTRPWPTDVADYAMTLAADAFGDADA